MELPKLKAICKRIRTERSALIVLEKDHYLNKNATSRTRLYWLRQAVGCWINGCGGAELAPSSIPWNTISIVQQATDNFIASLKK